MPVPQCAADRTKIMHCSVLLSPAGIGIGKHGCSFSHDSKQLQTHRHQIFGTVDTRMPTATVQILNSCRHTDISEVQNCRRTETYSNRLKSKHLQKTSNYKPADLLLCTGAGPTMLNKHYRLQLLFVLHRCTGLQTHPAVTQITTITCLERYESRTKKRHWRNSFVEKQISL